MIKDNLDFLSNNVKGTQTSEKNWSYFIICIFKKITGLAIFHKKHSSPDIKRKWNDNFRGQLSFLVEKQIPVWSQYDIMGKFFSAIEQR